MRPDWNLSSGGYCNGASAIESRRDARASAIKTRPQVYMLRSLLCTHA